MNKTEESIQLCKSVVENGGSVSETYCEDMVCDDCPLSNLNREDRSPCFMSKKATLEVAKKFLAEAGVPEQKSKSYSFEEIVLMNLKGGIERGTKFISDYNAIEILPNRTLKISSLKEERNLMITPSEMFIMVEPYLTLDDFDLEEEFQILGYEATFKKIEVFGQIKIARRDNDGTISVHSESHLDGEKHLIRVNN